jgi:type VI secretion system protein ImpL
MKRVLGVIFGRWVLTFVGAAALAVLLWFLGPLLPLFEPETTRFIGIAVIALVWLVVNLLISWFARRAQKKMVAAIAEAKPDPGAAAAQAAGEEVGLLRERLEEALGALRSASKKTRGGSGYLYELPWYMLIGPPGSGKTTALRNSGLNFPLSAKFGNDPVRGVGGTRNCDWWLCEDAVLLDTAGRYTTQDSDAAVDQKAWLGFLDLLKTFRPRQPINGAIVAIGLPDLTQMPAPEREAHARAIRSRLKELREHFGVRFPVYVVFAKLDLVAGFVEFFETFDRPTREQVWGMTFPLEKRDDQAGAIAAFESEFDALIARLNVRLLDRMGEERDPERRALIFGFPAQIASLRQPLSEFLHAIFQPSRFEERPLLRGAYLTSATQNGTPVDRLMAAISQSFALDRQRLPAFSGTGRGYFLTKLFNDVIFGEASLVAADPQARRRRRLARQGALAAIAAAALVVLGAFGWSYQNNRALIGGVDAATRQYETLVRPFDNKIVADDNVPAILPVLAAARALPTGYDDQRKSVPIGLTFGLYQGGKLGSEADNAYRRALDALLLPRLLVGVHDKLAANLNSPEIANALLEAYLILGRQGPLNRELIKQTVDVIWGNRAVPGMDPAAAHTALMAHLDALLADSFDAIPLDMQLVAQARAVVSRVPLSARAYRRILESPAAQDLPVWRVIDHAGPAADQVLVRASGKPLSDGIPGIYTRDGFRKVLLPQAPLAVKSVAEETWVLGPQYAVSLASDRFQALVAETRDLYLKDYIAQWDGLLSDVRLVRLASLPATIDALNTLSGPASPLKLLLTAAAQETTLVEQPKPAATPAPPALAGATQALGKLEAAAASLSGANAGKAVDDHFKALHGLVAGAANGQSQLDDALKRMGDLSSALATQAANPGLPAAGQRGPGPSAAASQLQQLAQRLPAPVNEIVGTVAAGSAAISTGSTRKSINDLYITAVVPLCKQALDGRYPIDRKSQIDVSLGDFTNLFRPGGVIDGFFAANLKPYVDTTRSPWRNQKVDNVDLGLSAETLGQFERAQAIRDSFFPNGAQTLTAPFAIEPATLSDKATQVVLDLDGQTLTYAHGPVVPASMVWPAPAGANRARLTFTAGDTTPSLSADGPWDWFRLLDQAKLQGQLADQFTATFTLGDLSAVFKLRAASVRNPFRASDLGRFRCPSAL